MALQARDLSLDGDLPNLHVREGKGSKPRIVPVHPELHAALTSALRFGDVGRQDKLVRASRATADRWIKAAAACAAEVGSIPAGRHISNHALRHSYARHLLVNNIAINYLSRWLGHSSIQTTLIYLELVPNSTGSLALIPRRFLQVLASSRSLNSDFRTVSYNMSKGIRAQPSRIPSLTHGHFRERPINFGQHHLFWRDNWEVEAQLKVRSTSMPLRMSGLTVLYGRTTRCSLQVRRSGRLGISRNCVTES